MYGVKEGKKNFVNQGDRKSNFLSFKLIYIKLYFNNSHLRKGANINAKNSPPNPN